jgi:hypothetical protein
MVNLGVLSQAKQPAFTEEALEASERAPAHIPAKTPQ